MLPEAMLRVEAGPLESGAGLAGFSLVRLRIEFAEVDFQSGRW